MLNSNKIIISIAFLILSMGHSQAAEPPLPSKTLSVWIPYWNWKIGLERIKEIGCNIDEISPFIYDFAGKGKLHLALNKAEESLKKLRDIIKTCSNVKLIPTIVNDWRKTPTSTVFKDPKLIHELLQDDIKRKNHIQEILGIVKKHAWDGIDIDYESLEPKSLPYFTKFAQELSQELHHANKLLSITLQPKTEKTLPTIKGAGAQDWPALAQAADRIRVMAYYYAESLNDPGPITPIYWLKDILKYGNNLIPEEKFVIALKAFQGLQWVRGGSYQSITTIDVQNLSSDPRVLLQFDPLTSSSYMSFTKGGAQHTIWIEDLVAMKNKLDWLKKEKLNGIAIWHIASQDVELSKLLIEQFPKNVVGAQGNTTNSDMKKDSIQSEGDKKGATIRTIDVQLSYSTLY